MVAKRSLFSVVGGLVVLAIKLSIVALVIATPLLGAWLASSLTALAHGPVWLSALSGLLLFPVLPVLWDLDATRRRNKKKNSDKPRLLTFWDRLAVRTVFLNVVFLAILLAANPQKSFIALATQGDWMLRGKTGPVVDRVRQGLFAAAEGVEWLYLAVHDNPYKKFDDEKDHPKPKPKPTPKPEPEPVPVPVPVPIPPDKAPDKDPEKIKEPLPIPPHKGWPYPNTLHPAVAALTSADEGTMALVAHALTDGEPDPFLKVKALHDWVADRISYDAEALAEGRYPPQDAATVFSTRKAVCAGYSKLLIALGEQVGIEFIYVVGDARTPDDLNPVSEAEEREKARERPAGSDGIKPIGHAWTGVKIGELWYLIDVTWDSGTVNDDRFKKNYRTDYFLTPPSVFGIEHFPEDPDWQLREKPISRGEFLRQPMTRPEFTSMGLTLVAPDRAQLTVDGSFHFTVGNRHGMDLIATYAAKGSGNTDKRCTITGTTTAEIECALPAAGSWDVQLFALPTRRGVHPLVAAFEVERAR
jgi:transglutaminase-like putative cysteine protease